MDKNTEYAFPIGQNALNDGMELRDYFASKALQGMLTNSNYDGYKDDYSRWAYEYADAMLLARKTK